VVTVAVVGVVVVVVAVVVVEQSVTTQEDIAHVLNDMTVYRVGCSKRCKLSQHRIQS
jgi:hypothetical protein